MVCPRCGSQHFRYANSYDDMLVCRRCGTLVYLDVRKKTPAWAWIVMVLMAIYIIGSAVNEPHDNIVTEDNSTLSSKTGVTETTTTQAIDKTSADANTTANTSAPASIEDTSSGKLGDYDVKIVSHRLGHDYEGKNVIYITYEFTNNNAESKSFIWALSHKVFQNGIELDTLVIPANSDNYDSSLGDAEIKTGTTLTLERAYLLRDTTAAVEVEVAELISFSDKKLTKTFDIAA